MPAPPYQKLYWGSYHKHTAHLSQAREHGAYLLLIGALWNNDGRLPADDATLAGYAKLTLKEWEQIRPKLMPLFRIVRGKLTQPRVTEDLAKYESTSGKRKEAGKAGGTVRAEKRRGNGAAIATRLPTKSEPESEPKKEGSEDKSSGAAGAEPDLDKAAWDAAVQVLTTQGGMTEKAARAFFGGLLSKNRLRAKDLLPSISGAQVTATLDPQGYLSRAAQGVAKRQAGPEPRRRVGFV